MNRGKKQVTHKKRVRILRGVACPITGLANAKLLRNSHIKPVSRCGPGEHFHPQNGLLLAPQVDALFDAGLISFEDSGRMKVSSAISDDDLQRLGVDKTKVLNLKHPWTRKFMKWHRDNLFQR